MKRSFKVNGLDCANCAAKLERKINELPDVEVAVVSFATGKLTLHAEDEKFEKVLDEVCALAKKLEPEWEIVR